MFQNWKTPIWFYEKEGKADSIKKYISTTLKKIRKNGKELTSSSLGEALENIEVRIRRKFEAYKN